MPKNVMLTDTLPTVGNLTAWTIPPDGVPSAGTCAITGSTALKCSFGDLATGDMRTVIVETTTAVDGTACVRIQNTVTATGDNLVERREGKERRSRGAPDR